MKHYWNTKIDKDFNPQAFSFSFDEKEYSLYSSNAVFSAYKADLGSLILTRVLIQEISEYVNKLSSDIDYNFKALDLGCGYGLISILLADKIEKYKGDMIDVSERALALSKLNIDKMNFNDKLNVFESDKFKNVSEEYDFIYTNPPIRTGKQNIYQIFEEAFDYLKKDGLFLAVIRKNHGAKSAVNKLKEVYGNCEVVKKSKGYYIIQSIKN